MAYIYIAFVDTPGAFATLIRKYLKQRYIHVVIAGDKALGDAYSVGRRNPAIPFWAGFEREKREKIVRKFPKAAYRICRLSCTTEQKQNMMERLHADYKRRFRIHYAVCGLLFLVMGIPFYQRNHYTCSSYIARLLLENGIPVSEKHFSLVTPKDFLEYGELQPVFEGFLSEISEDGQYCIWESASGYE